MSREIKFSYIAQHDDNGIFMEQIFTVEQIEGANFITQWNKKFPRWNIVARREYTGLKDKNGKEIYEGDIVRFLDMWGEVYYWEERAAFHIRAYSIEGGEGSPDMFMYRSDVEVIGNKFESPELLTQ